MAVSLSALFGVKLLVLWVGLANAAVRTYDFEVGWVMRNPDGNFDRRTMAINGQWPIPVINVTRGDQVIVNVHNNLGDQDTSLHFHGLFQNGTNHMDGPVGVTQCGIPPGKSFKYNFTIDQPGTYWYHSHQRGQYPDGLRGAVIVQDHPDQNPYQGQYDEEVLMTVSDWYHEQMPKLLAEFINVANPTGAEPVPNSALMNDTQDYKFQVQPGKTYFFRIVNIGAFASQYIWFEGHKMDIIEVDGVYTERQPADMIYITAAQRYGVLITAKNDTSENFPIVGSMDTDLFDTIPPGLQTNVTGHLVYDNQKPMPEAMDVAEFAPYDDVHLTPSDGEKIWENPGQVYTMTMKMDNLGDGANYAFINDKTYVAPLVPTLYTALSTGAAAGDIGVYGTNTNGFMLRHNEVIEIRFNNDDPGKHPFHLHGHNFQAVHRSDDNAGYYNFTKTPPSTFRQVPMRRDTMWVHPNGNFVIRFRSDNPGIWMYHCHLEWHIDSGLVATIIEAPMELQKQLNGNIPDDHFQVCRDQGLPFEGNAAGNTQELFNLQGENLPPPPLPAGFTARGIVALVFSCISAFLGMVMIGWYGIKPIGESEVAAAKKRIAKAET